MFHLLAKLSAVLLQPLAWLALLLLLAWRHAGCARQRRLLGGALLLLFLLGWEWPANALLGSLEQQVAPYARRDPGERRLGDFVGVVVLGGALQPARMWTRPGQLPLEPSAERMLAAARLARQQPGLKVVFSGGEAELLATGLSESARARQVFAALGLAADRVQYEDQSRDTWENAVLTSRLPGIDPAQPWLLLSSAAHLPRALTAFRRAGWNVTPYPVDFRTPEHTPWWRYDWNPALAHWQLAVHEWLGLLAYRLRG